MQGVKGLDQPLVHLGPCHWEVILNKDGDSECELLIARLRQNNILWIVNQLQQLCLDRSLELLKLTLLLANLLNTLRC